MSLSNPRRHESGSLAGEIRRAPQVLAGLAGAGFGLRDWPVFRSGEDNLPVALTPYAGLPFIVLATAPLIDRFVRTTEKLERLNRQLDEHVARREAELAANYERLGRSSARRRRPTNASACCASCTTGWVPSSSLHRCASRPPRSTAPAWRANCAPASTTCAWPPRR
jgi:hypothetical protein